MSYAPGINPHGILADGCRVCDLLNNGTSPTAVAGMMYANPQSVNGSAGITLDLAKAMVRAAVQDPANGRPRKPRADQTSHLATNKTAIQRGRSCEVQPPA
jgi:hypothetical protein